MYVLSNVGELYDGKTATQASLHKHIDIHVKNGRISQMGPHDPKLSKTDQMPVLDCSGYTVTPGLIDCHGHITVLGLGKKEVGIMNSDLHLIYTEKILYTTLVNGGVTSMRDVGGATHWMRQLVEEGICIGPRLKIAICMLSNTGGHADGRGPNSCHTDFSSIFPPTLGRPPSMVDGPWECRKRVREIAARGADLIKLCTSGGIASPADELEHQQFTPEEIQAICDEAHAKGLRVAAHAHSTNGIELAIQNGVNDIQHISFMDKRLVEMAHSKGVTVTPTSWVLQSLPDQESISDFVRDKAKRVREVHHLAVEHAKSGGLKILAGTDAVMPNMHGKNYRELTGLMNDGLDSLSAWHAYTGLAADDTGFQDCGKLEVGKSADFLICQGNVIDDPKLFDHGAMKEVVKEGVGYKGHLNEIPQRRFETHLNQNILQSFAI